MGVDSPGVPQLRVIGTSPPARRVESIWKSLGAPFPWEQVLEWPPDVFAFTEQLLIHADAYRLVSSPPAGAVWPPDRGWQESMRRGGALWAATIGRHGVPVPGPVLDRWATLGHARELPLDTISAGAPWDVCEAIISLHALADEACSSLSTLDEDGSSSLAARAWEMLGREGTLSRLPSSAIRVLPKTHVPRGGITVRSLARYLSAHTAPVEVTWTRGLFPALSPGAAADMTYRMLLLPWPLRVAQHDFRPARALGHDDPDGFGFFEFDPKGQLDLGYVRGALEAAEREGGAAIVVLPESSVAQREIPILEGVVSEFGVISLVAGVRGEPDPLTGLRRNYAHIGIWTGDRWNRHEQDKHHRWLLDDRQIRQYELDGALDPRRRWWEAIAIPPHRLNVFDLGGGATTTSLICEDLARVDEVAEVIRGIGPTTVFALLLDGPQIASRWPSRYASVLADDPGSTVVTMTSLGMVARSQPPGTKPSRVVALWKDAERGLAEIEVAPSADAVLLVASEDRETAWTADGRRHDGTTPRLVLEEVRQLESCR